MPSLQGRRLVVVSNRLPIVLKEEDGHWSMQKGSGGLVTALSPILKNRGGLWVGWTGTTETLPIRQIKRILGPFSRASGFRLLPVFISEAERDLFYLGMSNEVIWPLFHDLQTRCNFDPRYWDAYLGVNRKFARAVQRHMEPGDFTWVHDYHLIPLAGLLNRQGFEGNCAFFLHIPFPPPDIFAKLPWRTELLHALLHYEFVGFQTPRDRRNFSDCLRMFFPETKVEGRGPIVRIRSANREILAGALPISVDALEFIKLSRSGEVAERTSAIRADYRERQIIFGADRLDYTKGIPEKLKAFRHLLKVHPEFRGQVVLVQLLIPSRQEVPAYRQLKEEIDRLVGEINGEFSAGDWTPVVYRYQTMDRPELIAHYRAADVGFVTPLKDGMNLVSKEYVLSQADNRGVLVLSEFAGSASQLGESSILVNPYSVKDVAAGLVRALGMKPEEKKRRLENMRRTLRRHDVFWWVDNFLRASTGRDLKDFPERDLAPLVGRHRVDPFLPPISQGRTG
jgi:trehalose 6-phosphate synthase